MEQISKPTLKQMLKTAMLPMGKTMYIYGGGWNETDSGAGEDALRIGVNPQWEAFFEQQDGSYQYQKYRYRSGKGLDCSGYLGWLFYNLFHEKQSREERYVYKAAEIAWEYAKKGWGTFTPKSEVRDYRCGDIMSCEDGHVYLVFGSCEDGSVVLLHASPPGIQISGTVTPKGEKESEAVRLAEQIMRQRFPKWFMKYPKNLRGISYLKDYHQMRWDLKGGVMADPEGFRWMNAYEIAEKME